GGGGGGSGGGGTILFPFGASSIAPSTIWLEQNPLAALAGSARGRGEDLVRTNSTGGYGIRGPAWANLAGLRFEHDSMAQGAVQVRLYIENPERFSKDTMLAGYVNNPRVDKTKSHFNKWFANSLQVLHFEQQEHWEQPVRVAARISLSEMNAGNLVFYSYDEKTNHFLQIAAPAYGTDDSGYLHFRTPYAGDIIISDGTLRLR
ncbi:MAG: hypothetical protein FWH00_04830, partial [Oscillospiraceae bacterium]|nr:hypothetical protein [Oscillospiraceae bacterium]